MVKWLALVPVAVLGVASAGLAQQPSAPGTRVAACAVGRGGNPEWRGIWRGRCAVQTLANGSLVFQASRSRFPAGVQSISLTMTSPGVATVSSTGRDGGSIVWGEARQSADDRACWLGENIRVCAY